MRLLTNQERSPKWRQWLGCTLILFLTACATLPPPSQNVFRSGPQPTPLVLPSAAEEAVQQLILLERDASRAEDLPLLAELWAEEGRIVDGRATTTPEDDRIWSGRAAVLDRYRVAVFPNPPPPLEQFTGLEIHVEDGVATATHGIDQWRFVWQADRWWIAELAYDRP